MSQPDTIKRTVNPASSRPVVARDDQTTATLLKKLLQSQERLQTKVAKLEAQARPPRITAALATRPAFRERGPENPRVLCKSPGLVGPSTGNLVASGVAAWATCAASAPKPCGKRTEVIGAVSGRPVVDLQVGGLSIGASAFCTLLRLDIFHTLADRAHRHRLLADSPALRSVSSASLDVRGSTEIKIQGVAKPIRVTVLGYLPCKMVLREDALLDGQGQGQGKIDFGQNVLRWHRREWPMRRIEHAFEASLGQVLPISIPYPKFKLFLTK